MRDSGCTLSVSTALVSAAGALLSGCANPGPPRPPSLHLVKQATGLTAERVGNRVILAWTVPSETTDDGTLKLPLTAVLCRAEVVARTPCTAVQRLPVASGPARASDPLPPDLESGKPRLLSYRVELLNRDGHSAGLSAAVYAAAGAAPGRVVAFAADPARNSVVLHWSADRTGQVEVTRTTVAAAGAGHAERASKTARPLAGRTRKDEPVTLTAPDTKAQEDPGGMVDRGINDGDIVVYRADRVHRVDLEVPASSILGKDGRLKEIHPSVQSFALRGEPSAPLTFTFHDVIPPLPPTGVDAIAGGGFGQPPSIDLSWESNPEQDVAGYNIYRAEKLDGAKAEKKLNAELIAGPAYRDNTAITGVGYLYRVTAVDRRGHESAASSPVAARLNP